MIISSSAIPVRLLGGLTIRHFSWLEGSWLQVGTSKTAMTAFARFSTAF